MLGGEGNSAGRSAPRRALRSTCWAAGSSMIGGTLKTEITRAEALELTLEGFPAHHAAGREAEGRKAQPVPRTGPAVCFGSRDQPSSVGVSRIGRAGARRHSLQRRLLHPGDSAASAWPIFSKTGTASGRRFSRTAIWIWRSRAARLITRTCAPPAPGVLVRGGLPRAYYVGLNDSTAVCLVPRGAEEGDTRRSGSRRSAAGRQQACRVPPDQFADAHRR